MEVTLVCTPKIVNVCYILFTGPHQNLEYLFTSYITSVKIGQRPGNFGIVFNYIGFFYI